MSKKDTAHFIAKTFMHVSKHFEPSKLMTDISSALMSQSRKEISDLEYKIFRPVSPNTDLHDFTGDYHVTFADLEFWREWSLYAKCIEPDRNPSFSYMTMGFTESIFNKRRHQTKLRYVGVTSDHKLLSKHLRFKSNLWYGDSDSVYVDGKRPFGNSNIVGDIYDITGWPYKTKIVYGEEEPDYDIERAMDLFEELPLALKEILNP